MKLNGKEVLICDCEGTIKLPEKVLKKLFNNEKLNINTHLCRAQISNFNDAISGGEPLLVSCTQEAPLFVEKAIETDPELAISYVNIRERAGWSDEGDKALPKITALIQEATLQPPMANSLTMRSEGSVLIYGRDESALEIAKQVANRLSAICIIGGNEEIQPPHLMDVPIFFGNINA